MTTKSEQLLVIQRIRHLTGKIRGLLCLTCNTGIGKLGDNVEGVRRALNYLLASEQDSKP